LSVISFDVTFSVKLAFLLKIPDFSAGYSFAWMCLWSCLFDSSWFPKLT